MVSGRPIIGGSSQIGGSQSGRPIGGSSQNGGQIGSSSKNGGQIGGSSQNGGQIGGSSQNGGQIGGSSQFGGASQINSSGIFLVLAALSISQFVISGGPLYEIYF